MKVKDIIAQLQHFDQDAHVVSINHEWDFEKNEPIGGWNNYWSGTIVKQLDSGDVFIGIKPTNPDFDKGV